MSVATSPNTPLTDTGQHIVLDAVPWDLYIALRDVPENRNKRMVYDRGVLDNCTTETRRPQRALL